MMLSCRAPDGCCFRVLPADIAIYAKIFRGLREYVSACRGYAVSRNALLTYRKHLSLAAACRLVSVLISRRES